MGVPEVVQKAHRRWRVELRGAVLSAILMSLGNRILASAQEVRNKEPFLTSPVRLVEMMYGEHTLCPTQEV